MVLAAGAASEARRLRQEGRTSGRNMDMLRRTASSRALQVHRVALRPSGSQSVSAKLTASAQLNPCGQQGRAVCQHARQQPAR